VVVVLVVAAVGAGVFLSGTGTTTSTNTTTLTGSQSVLTTTANWKIIAANLTVGYNSGLWTMTIQSSSTKGIQLLTVILNTPTQSKMCTGVFGGSLQFSNCPSTPPASGSYAPGTVFTGYASGVGSGSAVPGKSYTVNINAVYSDGSITNDTISITAATSS